MGEPVEIHASVVAGVKKSGSFPMGSMGTAEAGNIYPTHDGARWLTTVSGLKAYYIQTEDSTGAAWKVGRVYEQDTWSFGMDASVGATSAIVAKKLAATKSVISDFLDIYLGCMAVAGGPVAWSITGMQIVVAGGKIKRNYDLYVSALEAFVGDDMALYKMTPTFYDHMFVELFLARIESDLTGEVKKLAVKGIVKNKAVAEIIGVFLGKVGEDAMTRMLKGISKIIRNVLLKVIDHAASGKPVSEEQIALLAQHHMIPLYAELSRVPLKEDRARAIVREAAKNPPGLRQRLSRIATAVDALAG